MNWERLPLFCALGLAAGAAGRLLLARLSRGVRVRAGPCEVAGALLFGFVGARWAAGAMPGWWLPVPLVLTALGVPLVAVDLARRRLPDALTLPAYPLFGGALAVAALVTGHPGLLLGAIVGGAAFLALHLVIYLGAPGSLGAGDVKLAGSLGAVLGAVGWAALAVAACLASVLTVLLSGAGRAACRTSWRSGVPHGPGLLMATWLVAVFPGTGLRVG